MAKVCAACGSSIARVSQLSTDEPSKPTPARIGSVTYSWPLGGGTKVDVTFTSEPTKAQLDVMMAQLKIMRDAEPDG